MNVFISAQAKFKLWTIIDALDKEVGGFGYAFLEGSDIVLEDVFLVSQESSRSSVDFTGGGIAEAIEKAANEGWLDKPKFVWFSWHSHHSMGAYWSQTDKDCIETYGAAGIPMLLSLVGNHKHEYKCRFDMFGVDHHGVKVPQVTMDDLKIIDDLSDPVFKELFESIDDKVKDPPKAPAKNFGGTNLTKTKTDSAVLEDDENKLGAKLERAWHIKQLMECDLTYHEACDIIDEEGTEFLVGPDGVVEIHDGFDRQAWSASDLGDATDPA